MVVGRALLGAVAALALCTSARSEDVVDAKDYRSFWLWAGVRPQPVLDGAERVYLLQGEVTARDPGQLLSRRPSLPHVRNAEVWLVVRAETLACSPAVHNQIMRELERWRAAGNRVAGLQVDFDARTRRLENYAAFLHALRGELPHGTRLGITGLLDWSANGDPHGLDALAGIVDEMVLQIYQGRHVIPGYEDYIAKLSRMTVPFRIGLLQGGEWKAPALLLRNPRFRGYVVFLCNGCDAIRRR